MYLGIVKQTAKQKSVKLLQCIDSGFLIIVGGFNEVKISLLPRYMYIRRIRE
jgi:hypothetical protein